MHVCSSTYHFSSHNFYGEGPDAGQAGHWWLHNITQWTDHPEAMPMDGHGVLGMIAPRSAAIATGQQDRYVGSTVYYMHAYGRTSTRPRINVKCMVYCMHTQV